MNLKKIFSCSLFALLMINCSLVADTWKFLFYMEASDGLADMAFKNITEIMCGKVNDIVDVAIQLHAYDSNAIRYAVTNGGLQLVEEIALTGNCKHDFVDAASWAFKSATYDHTIIVLSNHGWGALDPRWNAETASWEVSGLSLSNEPSTVCPLSKMRENDVLKKHLQHKGFMFNTQHTYLSNRELAEALAEVQIMLRGNKIDIVVFDTCMGSMLEVATCIAPYAHYLVGVQSCALRDGFDYRRFMAILSHGKTPRLTAAAFVAAFDAYYADHDEQGIYTCAALDLAFVATVNQALNHVVFLLLQNSEWLPLLKHARAETPRFCLWPIYTDLVTFCQLVEKRLLLLPNSEKIYSLLQSLRLLYEAAESFVVASCGGTTTKGKAHGFSIYLPSKIMENSYSNSLFAEQSLWQHLVKAMCDDVA